jgi:hypothetical protein
MRVQSVSLVLALAFLFLACERDTRVKMLYEVPPSFELSGSGRLAMVRVHGQKVREVFGEMAFVIWEIAPDSGRMNGDFVEDLSKITYGKVPKGYHQVFPREGETLPPLIEGQRYHIFFDTVGANGASKYFEIQNGKIIEIKQ